MPTPLRIPEIGMIFKRRVSTEDTGHVRSIKCQSKVIDKEKGTRTAPGSEDGHVAQVVQPAYLQLRSTIEASRDEPCFGIRSDFSSEAKWITYGDVGHLLQSVAAGLTQLKANDNGFVGLYGRNLPEWIISQHACGLCGLVSVPLYDTLGREALEHIFKQTGIRILICDTVARAQSLLSWMTAELSHLVIMRSDVAELDKMKSEIRGNLQVFSFDELVHLGSKHPLEERVPDLDSPFLICYTSGSTGLPKGVVHTHRTFMTAVGSFEEYLPKRTKDGSRQTHLSYLPLSHIMEQLFLTKELIYGSHIAFLTTDIAGLQQDVQYYHPTIFCVVPRVLSRIYMDYLKRLQGSKFALLLLNFAIYLKLRKQKKQIYTQSGWLDRKFFLPVRERFGGRIEMLVCGSAPLPSRVLSFVKATFSCPVLEGYGTTETGGVITLTIPHDPVAGHTGSIYPGVFVRLMDVPFMDIKAPRDGMGEVCVRSGACTSGYYKDEVNTSELFNEDGYLRTGDIGRWTPTGALQIVDRCKSMFKLSQGEYIAPEKVERVYAFSPLVTNVFVDGKPSHSFAIAIVVPDCKQVWQQFSDKLMPVFKISDHQRKGMDSSSVPVSAKELCKNSLVAELVLRELNSLGKKAGLNGFEQVKAIHLCPEPFTVYNGLLTPTMKTSRAHIRQHYKAEIEELYRKSNI